MESPRSVAHPEAPHTFSPTISFAAADAGIAAAIAKTAATRIFLISPPSGIRPYIRRRRRDITRRPRLVAVERAVGPCQVGRGRFAPGILGRVPMVTVENVRS